MGLLNWIRRRLGAESEAAEPAARAAAPSARTLEDALAAALTDANAGEAAQAACADSLLRFMDRDAALLIPQIDQCLAALRSGRRFWAIRRYTDALLARDELALQASQLSPDARNERREERYARLLGARGLRIRIHALIETGELGEALRVAESFRKHIDRFVPEYEAELRDVLGLTGRIYKQRYVERAARGFAEPRNLQRAIEIYAEGYARSEPKSLWHGVNVLTLLERARRDGVRAPASVPFEPARLGADLIALAESTASETDKWRYLSAGEVCLALGRWEEAERYFARHIAETHTRGDAVRDIEATARQLREVWGLHDGREGERGQRLVRQLESELGRAPSTAAIPVPAAVEAPPPAGAFLDELDRRLNASRAEGAQMQSFEWVSILQLRGRAVALVCEKSTKRGIGTGFLMNGGDLAPDWTGKTVFVTNYHVVNSVGGNLGGPHDMWSLRWDRAEASFTAGQSDAPIRFERILWESPATAHDACILEMAHAPADVTPIPLSPAIDSANPCDAVTVLGHPLGGGLSLSLENRLVTECAAPATPGAAGYLRYLAPTNQGCSGGPVLDWHDLTLVALHHAKANETAAPGQAVNEGVLMSSILQALRARPASAA